MEIKQNKKNNYNNRQQQHKTCLTHTPVSLIYQCLMNNCHPAQPLLSTATITLKALDTNTYIDKSLRNMYYSAVSTLCPRLTIAQQ